MLSGGKLKTSNSKNRLIIKSKNNMDKKTQIPTLSKTAVSGAVTEKDLMIGNLVFLPSGIVYTVDIVYKNYAMLKYWRAIPITEKWLKHFCFENNGFCFINGDLKILKHLNKDFEYTLLYKDNIIANNIKYIHKLQNSCFALSGSELQISSITDR